MCVVCVFSLYPVVYPVLRVYQLKILDLIINKRKTRQVTCVNENITTNGTYKPGGHVAG